MRYLSIKNFDKHQHYKDRRPPWIKLHVEVLDDYAFLCLQDASKAHLMLLWVLASKLDNRIPYDLVFISKKLGITSPVDVEELVLQGFIEVSADDGRMLASRKQSAMPETETETETEREREAEKSTRASRTKSDRKYPQYPTDVCTTLYDTYRRTRGPIDFATFRRETAPLFPTTNTTDQLIHALEAWGEWVAALPAEKAKWERASTWITDIDRWVRVGELPLADANGVTERGRLAAGIAA